MILKTKTALAVGTLALCAATALTTAAEARPKYRHHRHHAVHHAPAHHMAAAQRGMTFNNDGKSVYLGPAPGYASSMSGSMSTAGAEATYPQSTRVSRRSRRAAQAGSMAGTGIGGTGFGSSGLVSTARSYLGTNPTGRRSLWCGAFMDLVLRKTGHAGGGNLAKGYARYGQRVSGPQVGAIAVMNRKGGGHVGVVSGIDANGNPIIISGNHNRTVAESVYPRQRITAYVVPN
ncbi:MAG: TIGR02594 family protein [Pseudolabrys sp.]